MFSYFNLKYGFLLMLSQAMSFFFLIEAYKPYFRSIHAHTKRENKHTLVDNQKKKISLDRLSWFYSKKRHHCILSPV